MNPILQKELRTRMRGGRAYGVLLGYSLLLALLMAGAYLQWLSSRPYSGSPFSNAGRTLYLTLFVAQALLISAITPAITSGAISIEREQRTLEMVAMSLLRPSQIVFGKLIAAVAFVALLLTASLPLVSLSFLLGGLSPGELLATFVCLVATAFLFASTGLLWSSVLRSTIAATAATYATVGGFFLLTLIPITAGYSAQGTPFRSLNPIGAVFFCVGEETFYRTTLPSWISAVLLELCAGMVILNLAMARLEHYEERRPIPTRLWATAAWLLLALFVTGFAVGLTPNGRSAPAWTAGSSAKWAVATLLALGLGLHLALVPIFGTGERTHLSPLAYLGGMRPHRLLAGDLPSGAALLGVWQLLLFLLVGTSVAGMGYARTASLLEVLLPSAIVSVVSLAAFLSLGHLFSQTLSSRWLAVAMTYVVILMVVVLPILFVLPSNPGEPTADGGGPSVWNGVYLVPFAGILGLAEELPAEWQEVAWFGSLPTWIVTSAFFALMTVVLTTANLVLLRQRGRQQANTGGD